MKASVSTLIIIVTTVILASCDSDNAQTPATGPDLTQIDARDHNYFNQIYNRCSINNKTNDCNCVARVNVTHRAAAYDAYKAAYDDTHKPALEQEIKILATTIEEKSKNASDERIIESLEQNLDRLQEKLANGVDDIDHFELTFLPPGATSACAITK